MTIWVVGQYKGATADGIVWELQGVFDRQEMAVAACRDESYFIGPVTLNASLPHETNLWPGCYYPAISSGAVLL